MPRCDACHPSARLIIADPPYFLVLMQQDWDTQWPDVAAYLRWSAQGMQAALRLLLPGGLLYCSGQLGKREHVMLHLMAQATRTPHRATPAWEFHDLIIGDRVVGYLEAGKYATNLWRIPSLKGSSREKVGHPSQKPCELIERIVLSRSQPGDL